MSPVSQLCQLFPPIACLRASRKKSGIVESMFFVLLLSLRPQDAADGDAHTFIHVQRRLI